MGAPVLCVKPETDFIVVLHKTLGEIPPGPAWVYFLVCILCLLKKLFLNAAHLVLLRKRLLNTAVKSANSYPIVQFLVLIVVITHRILLKAHTIIYCKILKMPCFYTTIFIFIYSISINIGYI